MQGKERIVTLDEIEQRLARRITEGRNEFCARHRMSDRQVGPGDSDTYNEDSVGAEIAFCKIKNVYPDMAVGNTLDYDVTLHDGRRVDVKQTRYPDGHLIAYQGKRTHPADWYALMVGAMPTFRYCGMMRGDELIRPERLGDHFGHGPTYKARQDELEC